MLYLWMPEGEQVWRWRTHGDWQAAANWSELLAATEHEQQKGVTVFFPTASTLMVRQPMQRAQVRQLGPNGLRYVLEEYSLSPVDQLDVRYQHSADEEVTLLGIPATTVSNTVSALALGPWKLIALLPDFLLLPVTPAVATLLLDGPTRLLRLDSLMGMTADDLVIVLQRTKGIEQLQVLGEVSDADRDALDGSGIPWQNASLSLLPPLQLANHPYNVLPQSRQTGWRPYAKAACWVLMAALISQIVLDSVSALRYRQVAKATQAQAEQQFRNWFPEETRIVNLKRQVESHLVTSSTADTDALTLLARVGPVLQQANLAASQVRYQNHQLELTIQAPGLPALESMRGALSDQGLTAELGSVSPEGSQVRGTVRVSL